MRKCVIISLIVLCMITNMSYARVIYDIKQVSRNSYKIILKHNNKDTSKIQITGYTKQFDDTVKISYVTGKDVFNYNTIVIYEDMLKFDFEDKNIIYPNVNLVTKEDKFDDIDVSLYKNISILNLYNKGIINGYEDDTFKPLKSITREEFCTLFAKYLKLKNKSIIKRFEDIDTNRWSNIYINMLVEKNIIKGRTEKLFCPEDTITLGEMCVILDRAFEFEVLNNSEKYKHLKSSHWSNEYITKMLQSNIIKKDDLFYKKFNQDKKLTRGEVSLILNRVINSYKKLKV